MLGGRLLLAVLLVTGCRYGYEPLGDDAGPAADALDDAGPDGGDIDGGADPGACNKTARVADSFTSTTRDPQWEPFGSSGATTTLINGRLRVTVPSGAGADVYAGFVTGRYYDLTASRVAVEVPQVVSTATNAQVLMQVIRNTAAGELRTGFEERNGMLHFFADAGSTVFDQIIAYDPVAHRYWQLREQGGILFFEASSDGVRWELLHSAAVPFPVALVRIELAAGRFQSETSPGFAEFETVNDAVPIGAPCKVDSLRDDFGDGTLAFQWARSQSSAQCAVVEAGGVLSLEPPASVTGESCFAGSAAGFDLIGSSLAVEVTEMLDIGSTAEAFVRLTEQGHGVELSQKANVLYCHRWVGGSRQIMVAMVYDPIAMRFWRFAEQGGQVEYQTSPDGIAWTMRCTAATIDLDIDDVGVQLGVIAPDASGTAPGSFKLDRLNLPP